MFRKPAPTIEELKSLWSNIWSHKELYNKKSKRIENINDIHKSNELQTYEDITIEEIINKLKRTHKWKSPEIKKIKKKLLAPPAH